jgi:hypothetical protein
LRPVVQRVLDIFCPAKIHLNRDKCSRPGPKRAGTDIEKAPPEEVSVANNRNRIQNQELKVISQGMTWHDFLAVMITHS